MYLAIKIATNDCKSTTIDAPKATNIPFLFPRSRQVLATVIFTNPGGITPINDAKKVTKKSLVISKIAGSIMRS